DKGDDRVLAAVQRHFVELHDQLVFLLSGRRLDPIGVGTDGEALQIVSRTMDAYDRMDRLRGDLGVDVQLHVNVFATVEDIARTPAAIAHDDRANAYGRWRPLVLGLSLIRRPLAIALQKERLVLVDHIQRRPVAHDPAMVEPERTPADGADVIQAVRAEEDGLSLFL